MQKIKLIALDLDGTTLDNKSQLLPRTKAVLERAIADGIHVVLASGRAYETFPEEVLKIQGLSYIVTSNGAATIDPKTGDRAFTFSLTAEKVDAIGRLLSKDLQQEMEVFYRGVPYVSYCYYENPTEFGIPERNVPYIKRTRKPIGDSRTFLAGHRNEIDSIDLICSDMDKKKGLEEELREIGGLYLTSSMAFRLEISDEKSGKGAALKKVAGLLSVEPEEIVAFGNADNDVDMMLYAGLGVAVANSPESVKKQADRIAPSNEEEGVAQVLEELLGY